MRLYHAPASPFVRKVMILLHEAGATDRVTLVPAAGNPLDPGTMPVDRNPLGKVPALERDDGPTLYDSRVICRYLDTTLDAGLYPPPPRLWDTLVLEATADGISDAAVLMRYEEFVRPEATRSPDWVAAQWSKVERALDAVEARWMSHLAAPLDMGQIALGAALGYLDFRQAARDWRTSRPVLAGWWAEFAQRPSLLATAPA
ncbi:MAG: glutathione S-transferase [Rhodobacterales bacterium 32-66-7]|nr:MAG: glutathione S-transferase [Rhodobacterales bacterium 12-65-15]OYX25336.1 MAG: glutathione S-transferase [Rhodobacterales bacterium 32-66-7]OZA10816.1 MAG: glutathione S-transferase [Rhodobacterales bacterium 17-64-5]